MSFAVLINTGTVCKSAFAISVTINGTCSIRTCKIDGSADIKPFTRDTAPCISGGNILFNTSGSFDVIFGMICGIASAIPPSIISILGTTLSTTVSALSVN